MAIYQCPVCGEQYPDVHGNGERYFHVCPPLSLADLVALSPADRAALDPALAGADTPDAIAAVLRLRRVPRASSRNENIDPTFRHAVRRAGDLSPFPDEPRIAYDPPPIVISR